MHYCQKNNIEPPRLEHLESSIEKVQNYLIELPSHPTILDTKKNLHEFDKTKFQQPEGNTEKTANKETEPEITPRNLVQNLQTSANSIKRSLQSRISQGIHSVL